MTQTTCRVSLPAADLLLLLTVHLPKVCDFCDVDFANWKDLTLSDLFDWLECQADQERVLTLLHFSVAREMR